MSFDHLTSRQIELYTEVGTRGFYCYAHDIVRAYRRDGYPICPEVTQDEYGGKDIIRVRPPEFAIAWKAALAHGDEEATKFALEAICAPYDALEFERRRRSVSDMWKGIIGIPAP